MLTSYPPFGRVFPLQKDVRMRIDQPGQNRGLRKIDHVRVGWNLCAGRVRDALDAISTNDDDLIATRPGPTLPSMSVPARMTVYVLSAGRGFFLCGRFTRNQANIQGEQRKSRSTTRVSFSSQSSREREL